MPDAPAPTTNAPAQPRLLSGAGSTRRRGSSRTGTVSEAATFPATLPLTRPGPSTARTAAPARPAVAAAPASDSLPRWAKGVVIGGVLLAAGMPAAVLMSRSMLVQEALAEQSSSKAAMVCTAGEGLAMDNSSLIGWLFGGSYFHCGDWETREARQQRERSQYEANYLARQRARQQAQ